MGQSSTFNLPQNIDSGHEETEECHEEVFLIRRRRYASDIVVGPEDAAHLQELVIPNWYVPFTLIGNGHDAERYVELLEDACRTVLEPFAT